MLALVRTDVNLILQPHGWVHLVTKVLHSPSCIRTNVRFIPSISNILLEFR